MMMINTCRNSTLCTHPAKPKYKGMMIFVLNMVLEKRGSSSGSIRKLSWNPNAQLESVLFDWYQERVQQDLPISGLMIKTKAKELSNSYAISSSSSENHIKFSDGWLDGFKKRHGIKLSNREQSKKKENSSISDQSDNNSQPNLSLVKFE